MIDLVFNGVLADTMCDQDGARHDTINSITIDGSLKYFCSNCTVQLLCGELSSLQAEVKNLKESLASLPGGGTLE